jgi:hypothetical protein
MFAWLTPGGWFGSQVVEQRRITFGAQHRDSRPRTHHRQHVVAVVLKEVLVSFLEPIFRS